MQTNMHEAKSKLSQLVELALLGEEVIIAKSGKPTVKLVPYTLQKTMLESTHTINKGSLILFLLLSIRKSEGQNSNSERPINRPRNHCKRRRR